MGTLDVIGPIQKREVSIMTRVVMTLLAVAALVTALITGAWAFTMAEKVVSANDLVAIARVPAGGFSAQERIDRVNERLAYIYGFEPLDPDSIRAVTRGATRVIMVGDTPLITVTPADARANNTTVAGLTRVWLQNAREALPQARPTPSVPG